MENKPEVVSFKNVSFSYDGGPNIIHDVNLNIFEKDIVGIIGPNGGGKTTLLKLMLGLLKPTQGEIRIFNLAPEEGRRYAGYVPQHVPFDRDFPIKVSDVVLTGVIRKNSFFCRYSKEDKEKASEVLKIVEMTDFSNKAIGELSEGQKQRVFIARALISDPKLLILDEPTSSVDTVIEKTVYDLLIKLKQKMSIILVTHDISAVSRYVEKIACLNVELYYHSTKELTVEDLSKVYKCPVDLIAHGVPHRVLEEHNK